MARTKRKSRYSASSTSTSQSQRRSAATISQKEEEEEEEAEVETSTFNLSQQLPPLELSQSLPEVRDRERQKLQSLNSTSISRAVTDLSRLLLFKALAGEPIDRLKTIRESSLEELKEDRVSNALFELATNRLLDVFGFDICSVPKFMIDSLPNKYKDRYYVINRALDGDGSHSKALHENYRCKEKGLLMVVLAFVFCRGIPMKEKGDHALRWITDQQLYALLHAVDEDIPEYAPSVTGKKRHRSSSSNEIDVDFLLDKFVHVDYLLREKIPERDGAGDGVVENGMMYAMGPRAALEIGRRQLVHFCAEILDEQPDPTMLAEIHDELGEGSGESEGADE